MTCWACLSLPLVMGPSSASWSLPLLMSSSVEELFLREGEEKMKVHGGRTFFRACKMSRRLRTEEGSSADGSGRRFFRVIPWKNLLPREGNGPTRQARKNLPAEEPSSNEQVGRTFFCACRVSPFPSCGRRFFRGITQKNLLPLPSAEEPSSASMFFY